MTATGPTDQTPTEPVQAPRVGGRVRIDERARRLAARLEPGEIAVIDQPDLDRAAAQSLIAARPAAVLNAARSTTGRYPNLGPGMLLRAGIVLVDDLGPDLMTLREGDVVEVEGGTVSRRGRILATGALRTTEDDERAVEAARQGVSAQVEAFAASTGDYLARESDLLLEGAGMPSLRTRLEGRPVLVVVPDASTRSELRALRGWIRDTDPVVIAVDAATQDVLDARLSPSMVVGDMDLVPEKVLRLGAELVVRSGHDGQAPGRARLDSKGLSYEVLTMSGSAEDAAVVLADLAGASVIVTVGAHASLDDFLDRGRAGMASTFFTRLRTGERVVPARAVLATYRPRVSGWWLSLLVLVALVALGAALWSTPWGHDLWTLLAGHVRDLIDPSAANPGSVG